MMSPFCRDFMNNMFLIINSWMHVLHILFYVLHVQYVIDCRYCNTCITNSVSGACTEPGLRLTVTNLYLCSHGEVRGRRISGWCVQQGGWVPRGTTGPTVQEWEPDRGDQDLPGQRRKTHHCKSRCKGHKCLYIYRLAVNR